MSKSFSFSYAEVLYYPQKLKKELAVAVKTLTPLKDQFDSIVVRGTSGTVFGGALSVRLQKRLFIVRKPDKESSHEGSTLVTGNGKPERWMFVDDFVSSGNTLKACKEAVGPGYVGKYCYQPGTNHYGVSGFTKQK